MASGERVILRGEAGVRVTATSDRLFRAQVTPESLTLLFRAGQIPAELEQEATAWITMILVVAGAETDTWNDRRDRTLTRRSLINTLTGFRREVAQGGATCASRTIEMHLVDAEVFRLRHERLGGRYWGPMAQETLPEYFNVCREAVRSVKDSRGNSAALLALLDDAIATLNLVPERTFEIMARRGRLDPSVQLVTKNIAVFWTTQLGRGRDDLKGMIALADVVWRLLGQPKSEKAIREAFARHRE
jgi:hypothetical protein